MKKLSGKALAAAAAAAILMSQLTAFAANEETGGEDDAAVKEIAVSDDEAATADEDTTSDEDATDGEATTEEEDYARGDVNNDGELNVTDVVKVAAYVKGLAGLSPKAEKAADVNYSGDINITDLAMLAAEVKGIRPMNWIELLDDVADSDVVSAPKNYTKLSDIFTERKDVSMSWDAVGDASGYVVTCVKNGAETNISMTTTTNSAVIPAYKLEGANYATIRVKPFKYCNTETRQAVRTFMDGYEEDIFIRPAAVSGNIGVTQVPKSVTLSWSAAADADAYEVRYSVDGKNELFIKTSTLTCTMQVQPDKDYSFWVTPVSEAKRGGETVSMSADSSAKTDVHTLPYYEKAAKKLDQVGWNLESAFYWCSHSLPYVYTNQDGSMGMEWYANYGFNNGCGNCYVMAACFCEMAKMLGYDAHQIAGNTINRYNAPHDHSWVEIDNYNGTGQTYIFDPDFTLEFGYNGFALQYGISKPSLNYDYYGKFFKRRIS
ncbi:dockerin type I domain-containing protein [Ruminococcus sp.]|uniref:dockerin type I domain-containing protein n=1 Tax=Ruminococcus sp. TaxID=41978 RepID=UPI0025D73D7D|nr:dockerin type I domain-containing protein [Ruminococcus sp.]MBQ8966534.1 hypothetical protein [Ruminococcus sp.]